MSRALDAGLLLERIAADYTPAALSSSLGAEDMVLTDLIARAGLPIEIFTLDTGRLDELERLAAQRGSGPAVVLIGEVWRRLVLRASQPQAKTLQNA